MALFNFIEVEESTNDPKQDYSSGHTEQNESKRLYVIGHYSFGHGVIDTVDQVYEE